MQKLNKLWSPVFILAAGFVLGLGASNYFAADKAGKEIASTSTSAPQETAVTSDVAESAETTVLSTVLNVPKKSDTNLETQPQESVANNTLSVDISLTDTVDTGRQEMASIEPSPEELAHNRPQAYATSSPLGAQETDELESGLRQESERTALMSRERDEELLQHEML